MIRTIFARYARRSEWQWKHVRRDLMLARIAAANLMSRARVTEPGGPVVSLTTYSIRVDSVFFTLETIARGSRRPGRLILWLDEADRVANLPATLKRLQKRGLEIRLCENFGSHKKYYPYVEEEDRFSVPLITADDDMLYPPQWLSGLMAAHAADAKVISCYRARTVVLAGDHLAPYAEWPLCTTSRPSLRHMSTGSSGVLFPPYFLADLKAAGRGFIDVCPKADDLWLHANAVRSGCKVRQVNSSALQFAHIPGTQTIALFRTNLLGGNDEQIANTYQPSDIQALKEAD